MYIPAKRSYEYSGILYNVFVSNQLSLERFLAIASSTALNCFRSSSRLVVFFDAAADAEFNSAAAVGITFDVGFFISIDIGDLFFVISTFFKTFLSATGLSAGRTRLTGVLPRDELSELDEYEDSDSDPLESEDPEPDELEPPARLLFLDFSIDEDVFLEGIGDILFLFDIGLITILLSGIGDGDVRPRFLIGDRRILGERRRRGLGDLTALICLLVGDLCELWVLLYRRRRVSGDGERLDSELEPDRDVLELEYEELLL